MQRNRKLALIIALIAAALLGLAFVPDNPASVFSSVMGGILGAVAFVHWKGKRR